MTSMTRIGDTEFDSEVIKSDRLTLVDFGAAWCGPCRKLHPIMEELAEEYGERIKVFEVDVGETPGVAMRFGIASVPQLMFVKDGVVRETVVGLLPKSKIRGKIDRYLD